MSPRTVVFVVGPSRFRASGVSTPCIFRVFLSSADSLRKSPRIRRISVVLSEHRVSVVRSAGIPENRSGRSIPAVFTAPLGSSPGSRASDPGPFFGLSLRYPGLQGILAALIFPGCGPAPSDALFSGVRFRPSRYGLPALRVSSSACGLSRCGPLPPRIFFGPFCVRALSGHSGSFFPALCGGTVSVSLRDGCAVFPSSCCSDAEYSAIPSSFLLSGSKPACPGSLRILS